MANSETKSSLDLALVERRELKNKRQFLVKRAKILGEIRCFFQNAGFLEVETPLRIRAPAPEEHIEAEPAGDRYLITSPELQMKRMLGAGYQRIFQICHCFRRGERGALHLPEFTMVEWYRAGASVEQLMVDCENLIVHISTALGCFPSVPYGDDSLVLSPPWERITVAEAFSRFAGWMPGSRPDPDRFDMDLVDKVEPALARMQKPVFLTRYPANLAALARISPDDATTAERFELYARGLELANAFSELTDPIEQRERFQRTKKTRALAGKAMYPFDELFLGSLELGIADCAGIALGVDRLVMLLTGAKNIDQVVAFPDS